MIETLRLFVSATHDLEDERAVVGRALLDLPVKIGAEIRRTPVGGSKYDDLYESIANVDRVYFLMGHDITAPAGAEWDLAWKLERNLLPLRRPAPYSPAGQKFMRLLPMGWITFRSRAALQRIVTLDLIRLLAHPDNRYGLTLHEMNQLRVLGRQLARRPAPAGQDSGVASGGIEGGGVLLDDGRRAVVNNAPELMRHDELEEEYDFLTEFDEDWLSEL